MSRIVPPKREIHFFRGQRSAVLFTKIDVDCNTIRWYSFTRFYYLAKSVKMAFTPHTWLNDSFDRRRFVYDFGDTQSPIAVLSRSVLGWGDHLAVHWQALWNRWPGGRILRDECSYSKCRIQTSRVSWNDRLVLTYPFRRSAVSLPVGRMRYN